MAEPAMPDLERRRRRRRDLVYGAHLTLVAALGIGWVLRTAQDASIASGAGIASGVVARAAALLAVLLGTTALGVVVGWTFLERRDGKLLLLLVLLGGAIASRKGPDALDFVYAITATGLALLWFLRSRRAEAAPKGVLGTAAGDSSRKTA